MCCGGFLFPGGPSFPDLDCPGGAPHSGPSNSGLGTSDPGRLGARAAPFLRYAIRKEPDVFDRGWLTDCAAALPEGVVLSPIRAGHVPLLMSQPWSRDLCGNFQDRADFARRGLGVLALWEGIPVAGASSYTVYDGGIEIEIDTRPDVRRLGLALACGARLILDCLDRDLYPSWDAHDLRSVALAEKLGYHLDRPYQAFLLERPSLS